MYLYSTTGALMFHLYEELLSCSSACSMREHPVGLKYRPPSAPLGIYEQVPVPPGRRAKRMRSMGALPARRRCLERFSSFPSTCSTRLSSCSSDNGVQLTLNVLYRERRPFMFEKSKRGFQVYLLAPNWWV